MERRLAAIMAADVVGYFQIRVARALLRWSARELAARSSVHLTTIQRMEHEEAVPRTRDKNVQKAQAALEAAGIKFTNCVNGDPGVRFAELGQNFPEIGQKEKAPLWRQRLAAMSRRRLRLYAAAVRRGA